MPKYAAEMNRTVSSSFPTVGAINCDSANPRRSKVYQVVFGVNGTPAADNVWLLQIQRLTSAGTATAVTPVALDLADPAAFTDAWENHTVEPNPVVGSAPVLLSVPMNQRVTFLWQAVPGSELIVPAIAGAGLAVRTPTPPVSTMVTTSIMFEE